MSIFPMKQVHPSCLVIHDSRFTNQDNYNVYWRPMKSRTLKNTDMSQCVTRT
ncbi:predicted protein [Sclerotinia sclerotiorum 1980 UF-70]|uniref:Uncharacterized protein n=1 Tax=Sclerotinia sclerotiorum (strain ATCC 18683 / 1980 / Ss-1) TaxID=665079 RepID=A7ERK6_SCLS1|nr:predicted protein [Sclerotinia sclerotiorum 1980 UF-70]EDN92098.1 predicted protein [Sclerotinia sclerotiorum 1980 UF-70]